VKRRNNHVLLKIHFLDFFSGFGVETVLVRIITFCENNQGLQLWAYSYKKYIRERG